MYICMGHAICAAFCFSIFIRLLFRGTYHANVYNVTNPVMLYICCAAILVGHITGLVCPSVCLSFHHLWAHSSRTRMHRKTKSIVNVPRGRSNRCASLHFRRSEVRVAQL